MEEELFYKRQKRERGEFPDVYQYEAISEKLRIQIILIFSNLFFRGMYGAIVNILCEERGEFSLHGRTRPYGREAIIQNYKEELKSFILVEKDVDQILTVVEMGVRMLAKYSLADAYSKKINTRFKEDGFGYQIESNKVIRVDSQLIHSEVVKPALSLLSEVSYAAAKDEFLKAYDHLNKNNNEDALVNASRSLESTLKVIIEKKGWEEKGEKTLKPLILICTKNGLIPTYLDSYYQSLTKLIESAGIIRGKFGAHGHGSRSKDIPTFVVTYVLHMVASSIVFLVNAEKAH